MTPTWSQGWPTLPTPSTWPHGGFPHRPLLCLKGPHLPPQQAGVSHTNFKHGPKCHPSLNSAPSSWPTHPCHEQACLRSSHPLQGWDLLPAGSQVSQDSSGPEKGKLTQTLIQCPASVSPPGLPACTVCPQAGTGFCKASGTTATCWPSTPWAGWAHGHTVPVLSLGQSDTHILQCQSRAWICGCRQHGSAVWT